MANECVFLEHGNWDVGHNIAEIGNEKRRDELLHIKTMIQPLVFSISVCMSCCFILCAALLHIIKIDEEVSDDNDDDDDIKNVY